MITGVCAVIRLGYITLLITGLSMATEIRGTITISGNQPLSGAVVLLAKDAGKQKLITLTDAKGRYRLDGVPPDKYALEVTKDGQTVYQGIISIGSASTVKDIVLSTESTTARNSGDAKSRRLLMTARQSLRRDRDLSVLLALYALKRAVSAPIRDDAQAVLHRAMWEAQALPILHVGSDKRRISKFGFSPDGTKIVTLSDQSPKVAEIWSVASGRRLMTLEGHKSTVLTAAFSADSKFVVTGDKDATVILWDIAMGKQLRTIQESRQMSEVDHIAISPNGKFLALADSSKSLEISSMNRARLWSFDTQPGNPLDLTTAFDGSVTAIEFSSDNALLALGTMSGNISLYNLTSGKPKLEKRLSNDLGAIRKIIFSKSKKIAALDNSGQIAMWNTASYHSLKISADHTGAVDELAFDADDKLLISAKSKNGREFVIAEAESGKDLDTLPLDVNLDWISEFSGDARLLAIVDQNRQHLRVYDRDSNRMTELAQQYVQTRRKLSDSECLLYLQQLTCPPLSNLDQY